MVLQAAKELKTREQADFMYDLIGVVCTQGGSQEYIDELRSLYRKIRDDSIPEMKTERVEWQDNGSPLLPMKAATQRMFETLAIKKRLECGY